VLKDWIVEAEKLAKVSHLKGGARHPFRRGWATARKHYPSQDVARAGGWRDTGTMEQCYAREDAETILAVVNGD
jgi:hypothetical protein